MAALPGAQAPLGQASPSGIRIAGARLADVAPTGFGIVLSARVGG
jgi:hypothetical protein